MTLNEQRANVLKFVNKWLKKVGKEDEEGRSYWLEILSVILGVENATDKINFEKKVKVDGNTKRIDAYIPETHVLIEQKSRGIALDKKEKNSGAVDLTPYEQAKRYNDFLPYDERARWIITSNFAEIWIYDMNTPTSEPIKIKLEELPNKYILLQFLVKKEVKKITEEQGFSIKAGELVGKIYDAFLKQYNISEINSKKSIDNKNDNENNKNDNENYKE